MRKALFVCGIVLACSAEYGLAAPGGGRAKRESSSLQVAGETKLSLPFKTMPQGEVVMDVYYPVKNPKNLPVVLYTHGGGWAAGTHKKISAPNFRAVFSELSNSGFCVVSVGYRLVNGKKGVQMRDCVIDAKDALRYLSKHKDEMGIDPERCFVMGDSAGGHIAQMVLLSSPDSLLGDPELAKYSYKMVAGVSWYGPCDFEKTSLFNHDDRPKFRDRFGGRILLPATPERDRLKLYREMSPINYLTKDSAPLLMIQGDMDTTIPVKHAYHMQEKLKEVPAPVEIMIIKNAGHNWREATKGVAIVPGKSEIIKKTTDFLKKHEAVKSRQQSLKENR